MSASSPPPSFLDRLRRFDPTVLPIIVAALVLVGAVVWLLGRPMPPVASSDAPTMRQIDELRAGLGRVESLGTRLTALEARPLPTAPDLGPLEARLGALQRDVAARPGVDPNDFASRGAVQELAGRVDGVAREAQQRQGASEQAIAGFAQRVAANEAGLATRTQVVEAQAARIAAVEQALAARIAAVEQGLPARIAAAEQALAARFAALEGQVAQRAQAIEQQAARLTALEGQAARLAALEGRSARMALLDAARAAMEGGRPIGNLPNAPEALARFASVAPPTDASLRLSFEEAARAGRAASEPPPGGTIMDSAVSRLSGLITVRRGEEMLWGDAAGAEIERARRALEAGDLDAALRFLARLSPPAKEAMRGWIGQAEALVAARAALRQMAAG